MSIGARRFFSAARGGERGKQARGPLPFFDFSGSARCWRAKPRQGRSRRRRGPKASLYEGSLANIPSPGEIEGPSERPSAAPFLVAFGGASKRVARSRPRRRVSIGRRQRLVASIRTGPKSTRDASEASLYEARAEGLHARIRGNSKNSRPICLIREARRAGTEGTGPILAAAFCSHSPVRRPAHLGGFSGSVWISFPCLIQKTRFRKLSIARADSRSPRPPHAAASRAPSGMTPVCR